MLLPRQLLPAVACVENECQRVTGGKLCFLRLAGGERRVVGVTPAEGHCNARDMPRAGVWKMHLQATRACTWGRAAVGCARVVAIPKQRLIGPPPRLLFFVFCSAGWRSRSCPSALAPMAS